jgi:hypothetical protein
MKCSAILAVLLVLVLMALAADARSAVPTGLPSKSTSTSTSTSTSGTTSKTSGATSSKAVCDPKSACCKYTGVLQPSTHKCKISTNPCEADAYCNGKDDACPQKKLKADGTVCGGTGFCKSGQCVIPQCVGACCFENDVAPDGYKCKLPKVANSAEPELEGVCEAGNCVLSDPNVPQDAESKFLRSKERKHSLEEIEKLLRDHAKEVNAEFEAKRRKEKENTMRAKAGRTARKFREKTSSGFSSFTNAIKAFFGFGAKSSNLDYSSSTASTTTTTSATSATSATSTSNLASASPSDANTDWAKVAILIVAGVGIVGFIGYMVFIKKIKKGKKKDEDLPYADDLEERKKQLLEERKEKEEYDF